MKPAIDRLRTSLFETTDGIRACKAINSLVKNAAKGDADAKMVLAEHVRNGQIEHVREFACSSLARIVTSAELELAKLFEDGLSDATIRYWSILGYANTFGRGAYRSLIAIASDESIAVDERAQAIKCLAVCSKQPFDRQLPSDPGAWKVSDLRIGELFAWAKAEYPDGVGYVPPTRHPALDNPQTDLDKIVSRLDNRLANARLNDQDFAAPTNWLTVANPEDLARISVRWQLPSIYLTFLTNFSPLNVTLASKRFYNGGLLLFGASDLLDAQNGYSYNPVEQAPIHDWPRDYVVVASHGGDPFVLDLSQSNGNEAPVLTAEHGMGKWDFEQDADSFAEFLKSLI